MTDELAAAFEAIIEGAQTYHLGVFLRRHRLQEDGIAEIDVGMKVIDENIPEARDALIPLLEHENRGVRVTAALALLPSRPEIALAVLKDIRQNCCTAAQQSAMSGLTFYRLYGPGVMSLCRPDPRFPIPEEQRYQESKTPPAS